MIIVLTRNELKPKFKKTVVDKINYDCFTDIVRLVINGAWFLGTQIYFVDDGEIYCGNPQNFKKQHDLSLNKSLMVVGTATNKSTNHKCVEASIDYKYTVVPEKRPLNQYRRWKAKSLKHPKICRYGKTRANAIENLMQALR